jgi:hypothetical protein
MAHDSGNRFVVLHGLRVRHLSSVDELADATGLLRERVEAEVAALAGDGLAIERGGVRPGWALTPAGRSHHAEAAAGELSRSGAAAALGRAYLSFLELNPAVLAACGAWQLRDDGTAAVNDHADASYDGAVIARLVGLHRRAAPVVDSLAAAMGRFGRYGERLDRAVERLERGENDWFTRPSIDSYHTVWFELHEDLLRTLGIERGSEPAVGEAGDARPDETETV